MIKSLGVVGLVATLQVVNAFSNTYPLVAWSSEKLDSLALLSPSHFSNKPSIFRPTSPQTTFPESIPDDLCTLQSLLLISIPGLHSSDLNLLPSVSKSTGGIRSNLLKAGKNSLDRVLNLPYVPFSAGSRGRSQAGATAEKFVKSYVNDCGAVIEKDNEKNFWNGNQGKSLRVEVVEGLEDWELVGVAARKERSSIMSRVDTIVQGHLASLQGPYLVILTSIPTDAASALSTLQHVKRQYSSYSDAEDGEYGEFEFDPTLPAVVPQESSRLLLAPKPRPTSIFAVDPKSGLLHRYVFFTQPLIFCLIISLVILIPVVFMGSQALTAIETLAGLEGKMTGSVGIDPSKSS